MSDVFPHHTPYEGELPISVDDYLAANSQRSLKIRAIPPSPDSPEAKFVVMIFSEHGWALNTHRRSGPTAEAALRRIKELGPIQQVGPRTSSHGAYFA